MGIQVKIKINLILLSCQERFLNLRANMGISATKRKQDNNMNMKRKKALNFSETEKTVIAHNQRSPKQGVGRVGTPMKDDVCRVSILNLANRKAEKAAIRKAV